jgi:hypothetical protein
MARTASLHVRLLPEIKAALERVAGQDERTTSSTAERILRTWLTEHGHMQAAPSAKAAGRTKAPTLT